MRIRITAVLATALTAACLWPADGVAQQGGDRPPPTVEVVEVNRLDVTLTSTLPGRVRAYETAEVRPQVAGIIVERTFDEGGRVEAGDVLYRIDAATYEAALAEARAGVSQAAAQLRAARREADRLEELQSRNVASQQALDDAVAGRDGAEAALELAEAQARRAEIELDRTNIRARLTGEIGLSQTSPGALVSTGQADPLTTIRNIERVYVDVTQSAAELLRWRRGQALLALDDTETQVKLRLADGEEFEETGTLAGAEPYVNEQTGVVVLRLVFDNPDKLLLPGMYVEVEMPTATAEDVIAVPQEGVTRDRRGTPQSLVVTAENVVEQRSLTILRNNGSDWIVSEGLDDGDRVIVAGFQGAAPGATVNPQPRSEADDDEATPTSSEPGSASAADAQADAEGQAAGAAAAAEARSTEAGNETETN
ncbi:putative efflux pump periplasmic linker TtgA precursor [Roseivivax jejudonensis]|uniref:Putative efflux pump periplasmic linker TtgA n=1 Tax=Roseivivax jejudonensis TaxID=1529041 RepID=A0A1X6YVP5_9RHOB|nr:efflux RND transporter periplasmic adaptor subunit [Roseivivax jejudonensis]SLN32166.1 putative efflux pump periplasmic linker TtgA precursor [Roseivivax jejudonensis]